MCYLQLIFVYVQVDNEDFGRPVADYFGVSGDGPKVSLSYPLWSFFPLVLFFWMEDMGGRGEICCTYLQQIWYSLNGVFFITQILAYTGNDDARKFVLDGDVAFDKIKVVSLSLSHHLYIYQSLFLWLVDTSYIIP